MKKGMIHKFLAVVILVSVVFTLGNIKILNKSVGAQYTVNVITGDTVTGVDTIVSSDASGSIEATTYEVEEGFYFPIDYSPNTIDETNDEKGDNGINIVRKDRNSVVVSGIPTSDITIDFTTDLSEGGYAPKVKPEVLNTEKSRPKKINIGTEILYTKDNVKWNSGGNKVYYGEYNIDGDKDVNGESIDKSVAIEYRVLDADDTGMYLDADKIIKLSKFHSSKTQPNSEQYSGKTHEWVGSDLYKELNGIKEGAYSWWDIEPFSKIEQNQILVTKNFEMQSGNISPSYVMDYNTTRESGIKLLSGYEIIKLCNSGAWKKKQASDGNVWFYWLRSSDSSSDSQTTCIRTTGVIVNKSVDNVTSGKNGGVSPAFKINTSSVMLTSVVDAGYSKTSGIHSMDEVESGQSEWKFTLLDDNQNLEVREDGVNATLVKDNGENRYRVTVPYEFSYRNNSDIKANQISVMITDKDAVIENGIVKSGSVKFYGKVSNEDNVEEGNIKIGESEVSFILPEDDFDIGNDQIFIMSEKVNEDKIEGSITDYASKMTLVNLPIYKANVNVKKDGELWNGCDKKYRILDGEGTVIEDNLTLDMLSEVYLLNGSYKVLEIIKDGTADSTEEVIDTRVEFEIDERAAEVDIDYYTVKYLDNDDELYTPYVVLKGDNILEPSISPEKEGYVFDKWSGSKESGEVYDFTKPINDTTNIYAIWNKLYYIIVKTDGNGTALSDITQGIEGTIISLQAKANDGYQFNKWQVEQGTIEIINNKFTMPKEDVIVTAMFNKIEDKTDDNDKEDNKVEINKDEQYKDQDGKYIYIILYEAGTYYTKENNDSQGDTANKDVVIKVKAYKKDFTGVKIDNNEIPSKYYTLQEDEKGFLIVTINAEYLNALEEGSHSVVVNFVDGYANTSVTVTEQLSSDSNIDEENEVENVVATNTGDYASYVWYYLIIIVTVLMIIVTGVYIKIKK